MGWGLRDNQLITGTPTLREGVLGFSRETGPIEGTYGCGQVSVCLKELAHMVVEAEKRHHQPCTSWITMKACGVIPPKSEGLRIMGLMI